MQHHELDVVWLAASPQTCGVQCILNINSVQPPPSMTPKDGLAVHKLVACMAHHTQRRCTLASDACHVLFTRLCFMSGTSAPDEEEVISAESKQKNRRTVRHVRT